MHIVKMQTKIRGNNGVMHTLGPGVKPIATELRGMENQAQNKTQKR